MGIQLKLDPFLIASREVNLSFLLSLLNDRCGHQIFAQKCLSFDELLLISVLIIEELEGDGSVIGSFAFFGKIYGVKLFQKKRQTIH